MATRRSRLTVRPNIGGVKSSTPVKPAARKSPATAPTVSEDATPTPDVNERQSIPVNPKVQVIEEPQDKASGDELKTCDEIGRVKPNVPIQDENECSSATKSVHAKLDELKPVSENDNDHSAPVQTQTLPTTSAKSGPSEGRDVDATSTATSPASTIDQPTAVPTRARLRRFGKVNIPSAARGAAPKITSPVKSPKIASSVTDIQKVSNSPHVETNVQTENKIESETSIKDKETVVNLRSKLAAAAVKGKNDTSLPVENYEKQKKPVRARLPKTKPNLADLTKRRPKKPEITSGSLTDSTTTDTSIESSEAALTAPTSDSNDSASVADILPTDTQDSQSSEKSDETDSTKTESPQLTVVQPKPAIPRSPMKAVKGPATASIPLSPVKQPGDKRARTISTTEAPAAKRHQRPKVLAPTDKPPDRAKMRMSDLIHWRPKNNPMIAKDPVNTGPKPAAIEEDVRMSLTKEDVPDEDTSLPMPQVTIGPDGNIVINEQSLVMKNPAEDKGPDMEDAVIDETELFSTYGSFKTKRRSRRWSKKETVRFYKALGMVGIDFFLINQVFPKRSRFEVKMKFKREEKQNGMLIERVLRNSVNFDESLFDVDQHSADSEEEAKAEKEKAAAVKRERKATEKKEKQERKRSKDEENKAAAATRKRKPPGRKRKKKMDYYEDTSDSDTEKSAKKDTPEPVGVACPTDSRPIDSAQGTGHIVTVTHVANDVQVMNDMYTARHIHAANPSASVSDTNLPFQERIYLPSNISGLGNPSQNVAAAQPPSEAVIDPPAVSNIIFPVFNPSVTSQLVDNHVSRPGNNAEFRHIDVVHGDSVGDIGASTVDTQQRIPVDISAGSTAVLPSLDLPPGSENDQFVLVTVQPESGEDTVIHIYRVHGNETEPVNIANITTQQGIGQPRTNTSSVGIDSAMTLDSDMSTSVQYPPSQQYCDNGNNAAVEMLTCSMDTRIKADDDLANVLSDPADKPVDTEVVKHSVNSLFVSPQSVNTTAEHKANYKICVADIVGSPSETAAEPSNNIGVVTVDTDHDSGSGSTEGQPALETNTQLEYDEIIVETEEMLSKTVSALLNY